MSLKTTLIEHIQTHGPMPVAEYMRRCVQYYYAYRGPFGVHGDFTTAPEISQIFGELIGAWLAESWMRLGKPRATLCEIGPGRGTLMKDILRVTSHVPRFHDTVEVLLVENSPALCALQKQTLREAHPHIIWQETTDAFPPRPLLLVANEFFDALPIEQYVQTPQGERQRTVDYKDGAFAWYPEGKVMRETCPDALHIISRIAAHIRKHTGAALIVDYGYEGAPHGDTLQTVRQHAFASNFEAPGEADITAHVDFAALKQAAEKESVHAFGSIEQGTFLRRLGAELRATALCQGATPEQKTTILCALERLVAPHQMGALFKVLALTSSVDKPAGF